MESVIATREEVLHFLSTQQLIFSYNDFFCDERGSGYGCGYGSGSGSVYGDSDGYGDGDGSVYENGDGEGDSKGWRDCVFRGATNEDIKALNGNIVDYIDSVPTIITQVRGNIACGYIVKNDLTLEPCYIAKFGSSFAHGNTLKEAVADAEAKEMENMPIEERIKKFVETFGSLDSEHIGKEFYDWHHVLTGSCRMGRDEFCKAHNVDLEKMYSVRYFLDLTKESYGSNVIKQVRESYKSMEE